MTDKTISRYIVDSKDIVEFKGIVKFLKTFYIISDILASITYIHTDIT